MKLLLLAAAVVLGGCASSGVSCTDFGGTCYGGPCPNGTQLPTTAQLAAAHPDNNVAPYGCPALTQFPDSGTDSPVCCLPVPATD